MSFLPYIKKLDDDEKLDFQVHVFQYLKKIIQRKNFPLHYFQNPLTQNPTPVYSHYPSPVLPSNFSPAQSYFAQNYTSQNYPAQNNTAQNNPEKQLSNSDYTLSQSSSTS